MNVKYEVIINWSPGDAAFLRRCPNFRGVWLMGRLTKSPYRTWR